MNTAVKDFTAANHRLVGLAARICWGGEVTAPENQAFSSVVEQH